MKDPRPECPFYVGAVIISPDRESILLGKRSEDGKYTGPGGGANVDETPKQAAIREAFEEADLRLQPEWLTELPMRYGKGGKCVHTFVVVLPELQDPSSHHDPDQEVPTHSWKWYPLAERLPEPMDEGRAATILAAKLHLYGLAKAENDLCEALHKAQGETAEAFEKRLAFPIGAISPDGKWQKTASGWRHKATGKKPHSVTLHGEHEGRAVTHTVHGIMGKHHGEVQERMQGVIRGLRKKHPNLQIHRVTIHNPQSAPPGEPVLKSQAEDSAAHYAEAMDHFSDLIAAQEASRPAISDERMARLLRRLKARRTGQPYEARDLTEQERIASLAEALKRECAPEVLEKAQIMTGVIGTNLNSNEASIDAMNAAQSGWNDIIEAAVSGMTQFSDSVKLRLADKDLTISKLDDGLYTAYVREGNPAQGELGKLLTTIPRVSLASIISVLKIKGYLPETHAREFLKRVAFEREMVSSTEEAQLRELGAVLRDYAPANPYAEEEFVFKGLQDVLEKARPALPVGTIRVWGGIKYVKHSDGWVAVGGMHHGKKMGAFGKPPTHHEFADAYRDGDPESKRQAPEAKTEEAKEKPKTPESLETLKSKAEALGRQAFKDGKSSAPVHHKELMEWSRKDGKLDRDTYMAAMEAFTHGWHHENATAPVPESKKEPTREEKIAANEKRIAELEAKLKEHAAKEQENKKPEAPKPRPDFKTYAEAQDWIKRTAAKYKTRKEFLASQEYKEAYSQIHDLHLAEQKAKAEAESEQKVDPDANHTAPQDEKPSVKEATGTPLDAENPREAAEAVEKSEEESEYEFARKSDISNKGEDLKGSARHKRNQWKGLEAAERDGTAGELVKRDTLMKADPVDFMKYTTPHSFLGPIAAYISLKRFPAEPPDGTQWVLDSSKKAEASKLVRKEYVEAFERMRKKADELAKNEIDPLAIIEGMQKECAQIISDLRASNRSSHMSNHLVNYHNKTLSTSPYRAAKSSPLVEISVFMRHAKAKYGEHALESNKKELAEHAKSILDGMSPEKAFGQTKEKGWSAADAYVKHAERVGPEKPEFKDAKAQEAFLMDETGLRGLQWGNSVTDEERVHHMRQAAMAFSDLAEVLGLPERMCSFNGRLGLAIGARGHGTALAHFEPTTRVINLTRAGGVGSLAHEWSHGLDSVLNELHGKSKMGFLSDNSYYAARDPEATPVVKAMADLTAGFREFRDRMRGSPVYRKMTDAKKEYWNSTLEIFARSFERYVEHKLGKMGRKNTYLAGVIDTELWPNDAEVETMAPHFDRLFEALRDTGILKKALDILSLRLALEEFGRESA